MHSLTLTTKITKRPHVTQLLGIGANIWSLFNTEGIRLMDVARYLQKEYHLEEQRSIEDAQAFVELLLANDLIEHVVPAKSP
jgi:Coenzyme PQQ synthesis protein D (PqqD)